MLYQGSFGVTFTVSWKRTDVRVGPFRFGIHEYKNTPRIISVFLSLGVLALMKSAAFSLFLPVVKSDLVSNLVLSDGGTGAPGGSALT